MSENYLDAIDEIKRSQSVSSPILVRSTSSNIVYCSGSCALHLREREKDLEPFQPESSAFQCQCPGCGELI